MALDRMRINNLWASSSPLPEQLDKKAVAAFYRRQVRLSILLQGVLFLVIFGIWWIPLPNPVKLMVVLFHELSHVLAAYLSGGVVFGLAIDPGGAGVTLGMGGNELFIASAGYLGGLFWGCLLYYLLTVWEPREVWGLLCLLCCVSLCFGWLNSFTEFFGYMTLSLMLLGFLFLNPFVKGFFTRLVATTACLYPLIDVAGEFLLGEGDGFLIGGRVAGSDIAQMAALTGLPEVVLTVVWLLAGLVALVLLVRWSARKEAEGEVKRNLGRFWTKKPFSRRNDTPGDPFRIPRYNPY